MKEQGLLIVVSGPSGAGKSTVCKRLRALRPDMALSVSVTTRAPRAGERDGVDYFFVAREEFDRRVAAGELLEHAQAYGNCYGTPRDYVLQRLQQGDDVLLEIEMQGAMQVKEKYPQGVFVFVVPPTLEELAARIRGRGSETPESFARRFGSARAELDYMDEYDYVVVNEDVERAAGDIDAILRAEHCRSARRLALREALLREDVGAL